MKEKINKILFINTGGGIGDALSCLPTFNYINKILSPEIIYYYATDLNNYWFEEKLLEYKPVNLSIIKNFPEHFGFRDFHKKDADKLIKFANDGETLVKEAESSVKMLAMLDIGMEYNVEDKITGLNNYFFKKINSFRNATGLKGAIKKLDDLAERGADSKQFLQQQQKNYTKSYKDQNIFSFHTGLLKLAKMSD